MNQNPLTPDLSPNNLHALFEAIRERDLRELRIFNAELKELLAKSEESLGPLARSRSNGQIPPKRC